MCSNCNNEHHDEDCCCCECCEEEKELVRDRRELTDEKIESIIVEKYNTKDEKTKVFIRKALKVHGDWYDYSKVEYKNAHTKVTISCPIHGNFEQTPNGHLRGCGCLLCSITENANKCRKSGETFIKEAKEVHNNKYTYEKVNYINAKTKVTITCPIHGDFEQTPDAHRKGEGCPECRKNRLMEVAISRRKSTNDFIRDARSVHEDKYIYDKVDYVNSETDIIITCPIHGDFKQTPHSHLAGSQCPECTKSQMKTRLTKTVDQFIEDAMNVHEGKYTYEKVNYINAKTKVTITCPIHGDFEQTPDAHLRGHGCPHCHDSFGEMIVAKLLSKNNILFDQHLRVDSGSRIMFPDFILIDNNIWIEYNGEQHYLKHKYFHKDITDFVDQLNRDINKRLYCKNNNIRLIEIPFIIKTSESISDFLDKVLLQNIDSNTLVDYSKLYKLDNTGFKIEDLFPT